MARVDESKIADLFNSLVVVKKHTQELLLGCIPEEMRKHLRTSCMERLLALRALLDSAISRLEEKKETEKKKAEKVKVE